MKRMVLIGALAVGACSTAAADRPAAGPGDQADACGAKAMQRLVGRPRSAIPAPAKPELQRVACTTCAVTMDYNPNRLNFFFDPDTGVIKEVRCG